MNLSKLNPLVPCIIGLLYVMPEMVFWGAAILLVIWIIMKKGKSPTVAAAVSELSADPNGHRGKIVALGDDHYAHDKENEISFFITLRDETGKEKTLWGVDLRRVAGEQNLTVGDLVCLEHMGKQPVVINKAIRDRSGRISGSRKIQTHRNQWKASVSSRYCNQ